MDESGVVVSGRRAWETNKGVGCLFTRNSYLRGVYSPRRADAASDKGKLGDL